MEATNLSSYAEKSWGGLVLRTCHTVGEFRQVVALEKEVWGFEDLELIPGPAVRGGGEDRRARAGGL